MLFTVQLPSVSVSELEYGRFFSIAKCWSIFYAPVYKSQFLWDYFFGHDFNFKESLIIAWGYSKTLFSIGILFNLFPFWM